MGTIGHWLSSPALQGLAALTAVATALAGMLRWLNRREHPSQSAEAVRFSGRTRKAFLERVWSQRVVNGLDRSLQHAAEMHLGLRNTPELVKLGYAQSRADPGETLDIEAAYDQAGGQLLIVGPPGSGKTTEALKLMRHLLEVARRDSSAPVPELFPLASWARERKPIIDWLADQLQLRHGWAPREGRSLIRQHRVVAFLDGLDEVAAQHRTECVEEINRFWDSHRGGPLVVCSRPAEYEGLPERVRLGGGVTVCPPDSQQIDEYLAAAGPRWDPVREELQAGSNPYLQDLLATPLMLSIAVLAYLGDDPSELCRAHGAAGQREALWSQYVSAVTTRGYDPDKRDPADTPAPYTQEEMKQWLGWLASEMRTRNESELWLHEWSGPPSFRRKVRIGAGVILGLVFGLQAGLLQLAYWLIHGMPPSQSSIHGAIVGLVYGLIFGPVFVLLLVLGGERVLKPKPAYRVPFNRRRLAVSLAIGLAGGLLHGLGDLEGQVGIKGSWVRVVVDIGLLFVLARALKGESAFRFSVRPRQRDTSSASISLPARLGIALVIFSVFESTYTTALNQIFHYANGFANGRIGMLLVGAVSGLLVGLVAGLIFGLVSFAPDRERVAPGSPTQLIADSARIGLLVGLLVDLFIGLTGAVDLITGRQAYGPSMRLVSNGSIIVHSLIGVLPFAVAVGLVTGLDAVLYHFAFRLWLRMHHAGPLRWVRFLEWARIRLLLRSTGAAYEWAHLELRDYMAEEHSSTRPNLSRDTSDSLRSSR